MALDTSYPKKISEEIISKVSNLNTTLLADALAGRGAMDYRIKPVVPTMKMMGTAITVEMRPGDNLFLHQAIYSGSEDYVLVADGKGAMENAYLGELMTRAAKAVGLEGIVIDGAIRDYNALAKLNFPVFSKGYTSNGPYKDGPGYMNHTISCGGITVEPGDLVFGDSDGVVVVPRGQIDQVIEKATEKLVYEEERIKAIEEYEKKRKKKQSPGIIEPKWLSAKIDKFLSR